MASITRAPATPAPNTRAGRLPSLECLAALSFSPAERSTRRTPSWAKAASGPASSAAATIRRASVTTSAQRIKPIVVTVAARATRCTSSTEPARQALRYNPTDHPAPNCRRAAAMASVSASVISNALYDSTKASDEVANTAKNQDKASSEPMKPRRCTPPRRSTSAVERGPRGDAMAGPFVIGRCTGGEALACWAAGPSLTVLAHRRGGGHQERAFRHIDE